MVAWLSLVVSFFSALISGLVALRWWFEAMPFIEVRKAPERHRGSLLVAVHNPGRRPIFVTGGHLPKRDRSSPAGLLKFTPYRDSGITEAEAQTIFAGELCWIAPPRGVLLMTIGPTHEGVDVRVAIDWHRGAIRWPPLLRTIRWLWNPLRVTIQHEMVTRLNAHGFQT